MQFDLTQAGNLPPRPHHTAGFHQVQASNQELTQVHPLRDPTQLLPALGWPGPPSSPPPSSICPSTSSIYLLLLSPFLPLLYLFLFILLLFMLFLIHLPCILLLTSIHVFSSSHSCPYFLSSFTSSRHPAASTFSPESIFPLARPSFLSSHPPPPPASSPLLHLLQPHMSILLPLFLFWTRV